jgi:halocyanin-like protein
VSENGITHFNRLKTEYMLSMTDQTGRSVDRRTVLGSLGSLAAAGVLAGCTTSTDGGSPTESGDDGGDSGGDGGGGTPTDSGGGGGSTPSYDKAAVDEYLSDVGNYDGTVADETGTGNVEVAVGAEGNGGNYAFAPAAVVVDAGTDINWGWTGQGQQHNVVHEGGDFESSLTGQEGNDFQHTFEETGVYRYYCQPHKGLGMKGVVVVV